MPSKEKAAAAEPQPVPKVGGSFVLNRATGAWEPAQAEPATAPQPEPVLEPETTTDGTDS